MSDDNVDYNRMTADSLKAAIRRQGGNIPNVLSNVSAAVACYYVNSGYFRFQKYKEQQECSHNMEVNCEEISDEINNEIPSDEEICSRVKRFHELHSIVEPQLTACGCCGIRMYQRPESPKISFEKVPLCENGLLAPLIFTEKQKNEFNQMKERLSDFPLIMDEDGNSENKDIWKVKSHFRDSRGLLFHLHPELVTLAGNEYFTHVCNSCTTALSAGKLPRLSLASGVDFGSYHRINLEAPNLHEQIILSRVRLIHATMKVTNANCRERIRLHAILFRHDAPETAATLLSTAEMFARNRLNGCLSLVMVDHDGKPDRLLRAMANTETIFGRSWVIVQWLQVLKNVHPHYADIAVPSVATLKHSLAEAKKYILDSADYVTDEQILHHEKCIGDDHVHQLGRNQDEDQQTSENAVQYHFVTDVPEAEETSQQFSQVQHLRAMKKFLKKDSEETRSLQEDDAQNLQLQKEMIQGWITHARKADYKISKSRQCKRNQELISDFQSDDVAVTTAFPISFLLGSAYKRPPGNYSREMRQHLLLQYSCIAAKDRRLLCFLYDVGKRFSVINNVNAHVKQDRRSVEMISHLMHDKNEQQALDRAIKFPKLSSSKKFADKYIQHLRFCGRNITFGPMEMSKLKSMVMDSTKRYGPCSSFITLAFSEADNLRGIRATFRTLSNDRFPSVFSPQDKDDYGSTASEFVAKMREASVRSSQGTIKLPSRIFGRSGRRKLLMDNPVAFVSESKVMIHDICSILFGRPPEDFYGFYEGTSARKTPALSNCKGVLGTCLAYIGVVEDHQRGTLHYHFLIFGGMEPYVLQKFANFPTLCSKISGALDRLYCSHVPTKIRLPFLIRKLFHENNHWGLHYGSFGDELSPPLLCPNRLSTLQAPTFSSIMEYTEQQACLTQFHDHTESCKTGFMGLTGCRLCMPMAECHSTHPALMTLDRPNDSYDVQDPICPSASVPRFCLHDFHNKRNVTDCIIWDTRRQYSDFDIPKYASRRLCTKWLKNQLSDNKSFDRNSPFWKWCRTASIAIFRSFWEQLILHSKKSNGYLATFNSAIALCTGSHNNTSLLGSVQQAKAATFYICPYIGKIKFPLAHCLAILNAVMHQTTDNPSSAIDSGTPLRTTQHILQRTMNKLMLKMELSDFQIVADLLDMPSIIRSEQYSYLDVNASMFYEEFLHYDAASREMIEATFELDFSQESEENSVEEEDDFFVPDDQDQQLGRQHSAPASKSSNLANLRQAMGKLHLFTYSYPDGTQEKELIPIASFYKNRGKDLRHLSRYEYCGLVKILKGLQSKGKNSLRRFHFGENFTPGSQYSQVLRKKQATVIITSSSPPHPGSPPPNSETKAFRYWKEKADEFAKFILTAFRPEPLSFSSSCTFSYGYLWEDFQYWTFSLQKDDSILSKFRLMAVQNCIEAFHVPYDLKKHLAHYRSRARDEWDLFTRNRIAQKREQYFQQTYDNCDHADDQECSAFVDPAVMKRWNTQSQFDLTQERSFLSTDSDSWWLHWNGNQSQESFLYNGRRSLHLPTLSGDIQTGPTKMEEEHLRSTFADIARPTNETPHTSLVLNRRQQELLDVYSDYFQDLSNKPPSIVLAHGAAGTGKSSVVLRILQEADRQNVPTVRTSFNAINAIAIKGFTTAWLTSLRSVQHCARQTPLTQEGRNRLTSISEDPALIILDEISNIAPFVLFRLSDVFCQMKGNQLPFGGIPVLLVGDLKQLGPVKAGKSLTQALMDIEAVSRGDRQTSRQKRKKEGAFSRPVTLPNVNGVPRSDNKYCESHPYFCGAKLFATCRWFELTELQRCSSDPEHMTLVSKKMYQKGHISAHDLLHYKHLSPSDFADPNSVWLSASIIVSTNRERHTLGHHAAIRFAKASGNVIYRWPAKTSRWTGLSSNCDPASLSDPCLYEYFVPGAKGFFSETVNRNVNLVNATPFTYHSIQVTDPQDQETIQELLENSQPGDILTLPFVPDHINVWLHDTSTFSDFQLRYLATKSISEDGEIVLPIGRMNRKDWDSVVVRGEGLQPPSKVHVKNHFPLEHAFAITVHKAQGRTIDNVILALSKQPYMPLTMSSVYVSLSRVKSKENIRIFVLGNDKPAKILSLHWLESLKQDTTVDAFFAGFVPGKTETSWKEVTWKVDHAYQYYQSTNGNYL